jgi:MEDS: MEthanogen/methylotroph, DcmR Sensory domain
MEAAPRHHCMIYEGSPSRHLRAMASATREKLRENYRCFYLNSPPMVAGMRSYLAAAGVDVVQESERATLVFSSDREHLLGGSFDVDRLIQSLEDAVDRALNDGYAGLWATGDMTWELGGEQDFSKLLEYEWRLEESFQTHLALSGVCQYHADTLPREVLRQGLVTHPAIFLNETLAMVNPRYVREELFTEHTVLNPKLESMVSDLCKATLLD